MKAQTLITGATGTIGSQLVRLFSQQALPVRAMLHSPEKASLIHEPNVEIMQADFNNLESCAKLLSGIKKVFLLTPSSPEQVEQECDFIDTAKEQGIEHIIKLSMAGADLHSENIMARWHGEIEQYLKESGLIYTILQPTYLMQNISQYSDSIQNDSTIYGSFKNGHVAMVDVMDIATVALHTLTESGHNYQTYPITGPEALTFNQIATILTQAFGRPIRYADLPIEEDYQGMMKIGFPEWYIEGMIKMSETISRELAYHVATTVYSIGRKEPVRFEAFAHEFALLTEQQIKQAA